jgi:hypothetical protein
VFGVPEGLSDLGTMVDRFRGKTWIYWVQMIVFGAFGIFGAIFGALFWSGAMTDANGEARPQAGPPLIITGICALAFATLALSNIVARIRPTVRCFRQGIECNIVGATSLDRVPLVPKVFRLAWAILSLQGFRSNQLRVAWSDFLGAQVTGIPMAYVLVLNGAALNGKGKYIAGPIRFPQVSLKAHPNEVANVLNGFARDEQMRNRLQNWSTSSAQ